MRKGKRTDCGSVHTASRCPFRLARRSLDEYEEPVRRFYFFALNTACREYRDCSLDVRRREAMSIALEAAMVGGSPRLSEYRAAFSQLRHHDRRRSVARDIGRMEQARQELDESIRRAEEQDEWLEVEDEEAEDGGEPEVAV